MTATLSKQKTPALKTGAFQNLCFQRARNPKRTTKMFIQPKARTGNPSQLQPMPLDGRNAVYKPQPPTGAKIPTYRILGYRDHG